jgi:hypothetical protein
MSKIVLRGSQREFAAGLGGWAAGVAQQLEEVGWGGRGGWREERRTKGEGVGPPPPHPPPTPPPPPPLSLSLSLSLSGALFIDSTPRYNLTRNSQFHSERTRPCEPSSKVPRLRSGY